MQCRQGGDKWGSHRVVEPLRFLPQSAFKIDPSLPLFDNEILISVNALQIDSASFHQLQQEPGVQGKLSVAEKIAEKVFSIVRSRGKMHNPITNSGGIFLGTVVQVGPKHPLFGKFKEGESVVSLVSLTLTPLFLKEIEEVDIKKGRLLVEGHALIFESGLIAKIPTDLPQGVVLAALDVCGAPAQVARLVKKNQRVLILGLGKAGRSAACQAEALGAHVYGIDENTEAISWCQKNLKGNYQRIGATPLDVYDWANKETKGELMDYVVHAVTADQMEMSSILPCRPGGTVLFFGMQTSFQRAVLGAEGAGKDVTLLMGNGYVPGHDELMLSLVRSHRPLMEWFEEKYG